MMKFVFHTQNVDKTFYRQMMQQYIADHIKQTAGAYNRYRDYHEEWEIHIHPVEDWGGMLEGGSSVGTTHPGIPHGVTGEGIVKVYIIDSNDMGLMAIQNFSPIFHEIAHMLLIMMLRGKRGILRHDDLSGNKKGMSMNISTQEVHDRQFERKNYQVTSYVNFGTWIFPKWRQFTAIGLDLRDFIASYV